MTVNSESAPLHAYVGRQAIFDRALNVVGYELLYRDSEENRAKFSNPDQASAATMVNAFVEMGIERLVGDLPVFVNLPATFLLGTYPLPLPPERTYIEVLENVPVTQDLVDALRGFRAKGFRVALDDFVLSDRTRPLVELADVIKIDVLDKTPAWVETQFTALRPIAKQLLAEKVSTHEEVERFLALGFDLLQGHFLQLPIVSRSERMPHNRAALIQLLSKLYDSRLDLRAVERLMSAEVGLTVRLMKLASSASMSRGTPIGTINQAVARVGTQQVAALVLLIMVAGFDDKPLELVRQALVRARMCEMLARNTRVPADQLFTAGLLSLLDAILDVSLDDLLRQLPVTDTIRDALARGSRGDGGRILEAARGQDRADFARVEATGFSANAVFMAWYDAIRWADDLIKLL